MGSCVQPCPLQRTVPAALSVEEHSQCSRHRCQVTRPSSMISALRVGHSRRGRAHGPEPSARLSRAGRSRAWRSPEQRSQVAQGAPSVRCRARGSKVRGARVLRSRVLGA
eukprot:2620365-Rhodomonas_salina.2